MQALAAKVLWRQITRGMASSASHSSAITNITVIGSGLMGSGIAQVKCFIYKRLRVRPITVFVNSNVMLCDFLTG